MSDLPPGQGRIDPQRVFVPPTPPAGRGVGPAVPPLPPPVGPPTGMWSYPAPPQWPVPPKQRGFASKILLTLATVIFSISLMLNLYLLMLTGILHAGDSSRSRVLLKGDPAQRVVVLSIDGIINDAAYEQFQKQLSPLIEDSTVKALVITVNSPGGGVTPSDQIYHTLMSFKAKTGRPVVIHQAGLAASGGYYVSCAGDYIVAEPTTLTGNIGVLFPRFNVSKMFDKWGVEETTLRSAKSPFKNSESMFRPETPEANAYLQEVVDQSYDQFRQVVAKARQGAMDARQAKLAEATNGKLYTADQGLKLGLVDEINYADAAYAKAAALAGLSNPTVVAIKPQQGLRELLTGQSAGNSPSAAGGIELNAIKVDAGGLREMLTPQLMYLWDGR